MIPPELTARLRAAERVAVLSGAGLSAESGVPTFREAQTGLWARYAPEALATPAAFARDPALVWDWYHWRRGLVQHAAPNPAHLALAAAETRWPAFTNITQNVDGLLTRAGCRRVLELHGSLDRARCAACGAPAPWPAAGPDLPRCAGCGGRLRPDIVWFGEALPAALLTEAWEAARTCQIFLAIGTSAVVEPAAALPFLALRGAATVVEINPAPTPLTDPAHFSLRGPAGTLLPELMENL